MIQSILKFVVIATANFYLAYSECANGCNGHGKCTSYDMCICNRNWQANDCSERTCQFGSAHVDTPLVIAIHNVFLISQHRKIIIFD